MSSNDGAVCGQSGITIATGFDIGQHNKQELHAYGFSSEVEKKLLPFVSAKKEEAKKLLSSAKQTVLTEKEANEVDFIVKNKHIKAAVHDWNEGRKNGTPMFHELSPAQQTILMCRTFHQGPGMPKTNVAKEFYQAALRNDWVSAEHHLRNYNVREEWYQHRVQNEANVLAKERLRK